jgi:hypothetical protein
MIALHDIELAECRDQQLMRAYQLMLIEGKRAPEVLLIQRDNECYKIYDGHHRISAARSIKRKVIKARIVPMPEAN